MSLASNTSIMSLIWWGYILSCTVRQLCNVNIRDLDMWTYTRWSRLLHAAATLRHHYVHASHFWARGCTAWFYFHLNPKGRSTIAYSSLFHSLFLTSSFSSKPLIIVREQHQKSKLAARKRLVSVSRDFPSTGTSETQPPRLLSIQFRASCQGLEREQALQLRRHQASFPRSGHSCRSRKVYLKMHDSFFFSNFLCQSFL